ncbi:hypothetical protein EDD94_7594 [Streptomyces sp. PanSC9]|nr:hypothetical protein EDD94_7594 [Streptomyces sp. PanSC9]
MERLVVAMPPYTAMAAGMDGASEGRQERARGLFEDLKTEVRWSDSEEGSPVGDPSVGVCGRWK